MAAKLKAMNFFVASALLLSALACGKSVETPKSAEPEARAITSSSSPTPLLVALGQATPTPAGPAESPRPPKADEVVDALARVFNKSVSLDETRAQSVKPLTNCSDPNRSKWRKLIHCWRLFMGSARRAGAIARPGRRSCYETEPEPTCWLDPSLIYAGSPQPPDCLPSEATRSARR